MATEEFFTTRSVDDVCVVVFTQSHILDAVAIERMAASLKEILEASMERRFIFDFERVTYMSSSALGMLIGLQRRVAQHRAELKLAGVSPEVMEVFRITKLDTVFDIYRDIPAALEAFRKNL